MLFKLSMYAIEAAAVVAIFIYLWPVALLITGLGLYFNYKSRTAS